MNFFFRYHVLDDNVIPALLGQLVQTKPIIVIIHKIIIGTLILFFLNVISMRTVVLMNHG